MKTINTVDSEGFELYHDITQIIKDEFKGAKFKKGHIITKEDIPILLSLGKDHVYVVEESEKDNLIHENDAAQFMRDLTINDFMKSTNVKEGKIELVSDIDGYFLVNEELLKKVNLLNDFIIASKKGDIPVKKGDKLAAMKIIPLNIEENKIMQFKNILGNEIMFELKEFKIKKAGIVTTGSEIFYGRIKDEFTPVVVEKLSFYGVEVIAHETVHDNTDLIVKSINKLKDMGCEIILCTGGMSVDADDLTPKAIKTTAPDFVTYGTPVIPGAMMALSYFEDGTPIFGLPGSVMFCEKTVFDIILPRVLSNIKINKEFIASLGYGGLL